jgi:hypothetical protein
MARRRKRARDNPGLDTWLVIGAGVALLGGAAYVIFKPAATTGATTAAALTGGLPASTGPNIPAATADLNVCQAATRLYAIANANPSDIGSATSAAAYAAQCTAAGGTFTQ